MLALVFLLLPALPAFAADITVNADGAEDTASTCTLTEAWNSAKANANRGGCVASGTYGDDTIFLNLDVTGGDLSMTGVSGGITIEGRGHTFTMTVNHGQHFNAGTGSLTINNLVMTRGPNTGRASGGGAIFVGSATVTVNDSVFHGNLAWDDGGAIIIGDGTVTINRSVFYNNSTDGNNGEGGAIAVSRGNLNVNSSVFYNNGGRGVIASHGARTGHIHLRHLTIFNNKGSLGALGFTGGSTNHKIGGHFTLQNSILYGNQGGACRLSFSFAESATHTRTITNNILDDSGSTDCKQAAQLKVNPGLSAPSNVLNYLPLSAGSPAIDAAPCITGVPALARDIRGVSRPAVGSLCDIGAFEFVPPPASSGASSSSSADRTISCENRLHADLTAPYAIFPCEGRLEFWWIDAHSRGQKQFSVPQVNALIRSGQAGGQLIQTSHPGNGKPVVVTWLAEAQQIEVSAFYSDKPPNQVNVNKAYIIRIDRNLQVARAEAATAAVRSLTNCMVTTTDILNFRDGPGGDIQTMVPYNVTLTAMARTAGWFQVDYHGETGWISADYVIPEENCG